MTIMVMMMLVAWCSLAFHQKTKQSRIIGEAFLQRIIVLDHQCNLQIFDSNYENCILLSGFVVGS